MGGGWTVRLVSPSAQARHVADPDLSWVAERAAAAKLPRGWEARRDARVQPTYVEVATGKTLLCYKTLPQSEPEPSEQSSEAAVQTFRSKLADTLESTVLVHW